ncbi:hypothetical protein BJX62DRAFT_237363 [Aspergillus germanicus]
MAKPHKALLIADTLTCILLQVDNNTLLKAQRVCRQWRDLIQASPDLQVKLFFKAALTCPSVDKTPSLNPIFTSGQCSIDERQLFDSSSTPFRATVLRFDPEIIKHRDQLRVSQIHYRELWHSVLSLPIATRIKDGRDGMEVTLASWKNILVVSNSYPANLRFLERMFFDRAKCADFYDLIFIRHLWDVRLYRNTVRGRSGQWSEKVLSPLEIWLESVEPWVRVEK